MTQSGQTTDAYGYRIMDLSLREYQVPDDPTLVQLYESVFGVKDYLVPGNRLLMSIAMGFFVNLDHI